MIDADNAASGSHDWHGSSMDQIWAALETQDGTVHNDVIKSWRTMAELVGAHIGVVVDYREKLSEAWSPETSAAAAAYQTRIQHLLDSLTETQSAAWDNYYAFSSVAAELDVARSQIKAKYDEYKANELTLAAAKQQSTPATTGTLGTPAPTPSGNEPGVSPEVARRQEALLNEARIVMAGLSSTVTGNTARLRLPSQYSLSRANLDPGQPDEPSLPYPIPVFPSQSTSKSSGGRAPNVGTARTGNQSIGTPPTANRLGPILAGSSVLPAATTPVSGHGALIPNQPFQPGPASPSPPIGQVGVARPSISAPSAPTSPSRGIVPHAPSGAAIGGSRPIVPSGIIGNSGMGTQGSRLGGSPKLFGGSGIDGKGIIGSTPPSKLNASSSPIQGHGQGDLTRPPTAARASNGSGYPLAGTATSVARRQEADGGTRQHWDPDEPWATEQGVQPVLLPPKEPDHINPGPAIGLP